MVKNGRLPAFGTGAGSSKYMAVYMKYELAQLLYKGERDTILGAENVY